MIFNQLCLENFGIFQGRNKFRLDFADDKQPNKSIVLIGGMNGRGKTTFLEAVLLVLYGRYSVAFKETELNYTDYLRKFTNTSYGNTKASIELDFSVVSEGEKINLKVKRSWDASKSRIFEQLDVWTDGVYDPHLSQNWDLYIEEIIPAGIAGLFFFDGEKVSSLAENLSDMHTKKAIDSLLGIDIIDRLTADIRRIISRTQEQLTSVEIQEDTKLIETQRATIIEELTENRELMSKYDEERSLLIIQLTEAEELFIKEGGTLEQGLEDLQKHKSQLQEELTTSKSSLNQIASGFLPLTLIEPLLREMDGQVRAEQFTMKANHLTTYVEELATRLTKQFENLDGQLKAKLGDFFEAEKKNLEVETIDSLVFDLSPIAHDQLKNMLNGAKRNKSEFIDTELRKVHQLEAELSKFDKFLAEEVNQETISNRLAEIKQLSGEIMVLDTLISNKEDAIEKLEKELDIVESELRKLLDKILLNENEEVNARRIIEYSLKTLDTMEVFKEALAKSKVKELGSQILECFTFLIDKATLVENIDVDPRTYELKLTSKNGKQLLTSQLSAGERQMLAVSILWGLARSSGHKMPVIIDTPMARLDSSHRSNYVKHYLPHASHQLIALSTDEEIVNQYLDTLEPNISHKYLLSYSEKTRSTTVVDGYFEGGKSW